MELRFTEKNFKWLLHVDCLMKENEDELIRNLLLFGFLLPFLVLRITLKNTVLLELPIQ